MHTINSLPSYLETSLCLKEGVMIELGMRSMKVMTRLT